MTVAYDKYYETENLFGRPYPELIGFFSSYPKKGKILDLGCGQGRDAIPLSRLGYEVTGLDNSKVGIAQMNKIAKKENLALTGLVGDIFTFNNFADFDFILLNSMFHFLKKDREREIGFIRNLAEKVKAEVVIVFCVQNTGDKIRILNDIIDVSGKLERILEKEFDYVFENSESGHKSRTNYKMIVVENKNHEA